ncbi:hypothetical protein A464_3577 [Salmonella bongori N268-08]|uniref:Uncharacterized protein n=1 Tax=Salmonella bongori N268-08 TaxID=1197719 RepID=S5MVS7_SALBN|nr:hypothetical protein A464_3577 [Salmonella bongori N268-08]
MVNRDKAHRFTYLEKITIDEKHCDSCHAAALIMAGNPLLLWKMFLKR